MELEAWEDVGDEQTSFTVQTSGSRGAHMDRYYSRGLTVNRNSASPCQGRLLDE
jgi:hypothetical protein